MSEFYDDYEDEFGEELSEEDELESKKKKTKKQKVNADILLGIAGFCLALSSAFFPWYVFLNQEKFSVKEMAYGEDRPLPGAWQGRAIVNVSPQAIPGRNTPIQEPVLPPDDITTASIPDSPDQPNLDQNIDNLAVDGPQSFPFRPKYRLVHVVNGRALIEDASGTYIVKVGSALPDNRRLAALEKRDGGWVIVTSDGNVLAN